MTWEELKNKYHLRLVDESCATCKYGSMGYEGECKCLHPSLDDPDSIWNYTLTHSVCDLWTDARGGEK